MKLKHLSLLAALALSAAVAVAADDAAPKRKRPSTRPSAAATTQAALVPYPLKTCIVSGEEYGGDMGDPVVLAYQGREMKFCCSSCVKKFKKDPEKYLKQLDEKTKAPSAPAPPK